MTSIMLPFARRGALVGLVLAAAACGTKDAADPLAPGGPFGRVRFVNLITDTTRGRVNAILERVPFGVNMTYTQATPAGLAAPSTALYSPVLTGSRSIVLKRTADTATVVATLAFTSDASVDKTVFAIGGAGASAVSGFVTTDDNSVAPTAAQARVRVTNMSPTAGAIDVFFTAAGADLSSATPAATNIAYQGSSGYLTLPAGATTFRAVPAGTAPAARNASVRITQAITFAGGTGRTVVTADNSVGGAPLRAFVLSDR